MSNRIHNFDHLEREILSIFLPSLNLLCICIYHPYWKNSQEHLCDLNALSSIVDWTRSNKNDHCRIIITGDFNDLNTHLTDIERSIGVENVVNFSTRGINSLDLILTNCSNYYNPPKKITKLGHSDHDAILWQCKKQLVVDKTTRKTKIRFMKKHNKQKFLLEVSQTDWSAIVNEASTLDETTDLFHASLLSLKEKHESSKMVKISNYDKKWITTAYKTLVNKKMKFYNKGNHSMFLEYRKRCVAKLKHLKTSFVEDAVNSKQSKKLWNCINSLGGMSTTSGHNKKLWTSAQEECEDLNTLFSSVFVRESPAINVDTSKLPSCHLELNIGLVKSMLKNLKKSAPGVDNLPYWIFKQAAEDLAPVVTLIFNWSLASGIFPSLYKHANISPIPKCGNPSKSDFRPISNLPCLSKVLERFAINGWIGQNWSRFGKDQFAFVKGLGTGTTSALTYINVKILQHLDRSPGAVRLLLVDYSKAFDKVQHSTVLQSLADVRVSTEGIYWWANFLSNRKQRVKIGHASSEWTDVMSGVPQGSVSGPVCFAAVNQHLHAVSKNSEFVKYADDNTLLHYIRTKNDDQFQHEFDNIQLQSSNLGMIINMEKTVELRVVTKNDLQFEPLITADGQNVTVVSHTKLLGCIVSDNCKWNLNVQQTLRKASQNIHLLAVLKKARMPTKYLLTVYTSKIRSVMEYGFPAMCNMPAYLLQRLQHLENRACRIAGAEPPVPLHEYLTERCVNLARKSNDKNHRLHNLFKVNVRHNHIVAPACKTRRYRDSFVKFANF